MKPLHVDQLPNFVKRFGNFIDGELRSIEIISPTQITLNLACQDIARGYDWLSLEFEFKDISEASLIDNDKLLHVDMSNGITLTNKENLFTFKINNATLKIVAKELKYQEKQF